MLDRDTILRLAREVGFHIDSDEVDGYTTDLFYFAASIERLTLERAKAVCLSAPLKHPNQDVREACANAVLGLGEKT